MDQKYPNPPKDKHRPLSYRPLPGYDILFDRYYPRFCKLARRKLANRQEAEDLVTDYFISLWEKYNRFGTEQAAIRFLSSGILKGCTSSNGHEFTLFQEEDTLLPGSDAVARDQEKKGLWSRVDMILHRLPSGHQKIFNLYYREGFSITQVAEYLGSSPSSIQNKLAWSIYILKKYFLKPKAPV